jgi:hypothetical protein
MSIGLQAYLQGYMHEKQAAEPTSDDLRQKSLAGRHKLEHGRGYGPALKDRSVSVSGTDGYTGHAEDGPDTYSGDVTRHTDIGEVDKDSPLYNVADPASSQLSRADIIHPSGRANTTTGLIGSYLDDLSRKGELDQQNSPIWGNPLMRDWYASRPVLEAHQTGKGSWHSEQDADFRRMMDEYNAEHLAKIQSQVTRSGLGADKGIPEYSLKDILRSYGRTGYVDGSKGGDAVTKRY